MQNGQGGANEPTEACSLKAALTDIPVACFDYDSIQKDEFESSYGRRLFDRVFEANAKVRKRLQPVFDAAPDAFTTKRRKGSPNISAGKIGQIRQLRHEGVPVAEIAKIVGVSDQTVYRWINNQPS